jgi:alpha-L-rhamnosidase
MEQKMAKRMILRKCGWQIHLMAAGILAVTAGATAQIGRPTTLECESLVAPIGMDVAHPRLSWKLQDSRDGAKQTAYEIQVALDLKTLHGGNANVWDSGRVESDQSVGVPYSGPALAASKRYYWRVLVWDKDGKPYPASDPSWWETGLLEKSNWKGKWIGYEEPEEHAWRESGAIWITNVKEETVPEGDTRHDFRIGFEVKKEVARAILYATGQDTAAAWVNGSKVIESSPLLASGSLPWKKYQMRDVTEQIHSGRNLLAVEVTRFARHDQQPAQNSGQMPLSAVLALIGKDGQVEVIKSGQSGWKAALNAVGNWQSAQFDDGSWKEAIPYAAHREAFDLGEVGRATRTGSVKALRRTFDIRKGLVSARIYATALGAYNLRLNGQTVGDQVLAPGWTDFRQHVVYQAYDVTSRVKPGKNVIGALLAAGWYATPLGWAGEGFNYGKTPPALRLQFRLEYGDGTVDGVVSDESWKAEASPTLSAEIYDGETYDARKITTGWDTASFDDKNWKPAELENVSEPKIEWQYFQPIREEKLLAAKTVSSPRSGVYVFDFGQNLSGVAKIRARGNAGTDVELRFAEVLNPDGTLYTDNLRTAKVTDHFILAGKGDEEFQPAFTYHGFRYLEVSGLGYAPKMEDVKAVVFHTDAPFTSALKTDNAMLNQLWSNILWGQRSNFVGVPTDCPQRDERLGWSADAQVFWRTAAYNMDLAAFTRKYSADLRGTQIGTDMYGIFAPGLQQQHPASGTGWSDAGVIVPWTSWIQTGDRAVIEENWAAMERYLAAIEAANPDFLWRKNYGIPFADWLAPEGVTPVDLIATAYWAYDATLMKQMAHSMGKSKDAEKYAALFEKIRDAFNKAYVHEDGFVGAVPPPPVFASGTATKLSDKPVETQTGYVLAIHMNLLDERHRNLAGQRLAERIEANHGRLGTGFLGTPYLLGALTDTGHVDLAYRLLLSTDYPSWGYLVEHGATTMWERWNSDQMRGDPSMNSYNHYAYGAVADWIYRYAAGIEASPDDPGFHTILLGPRFAKSLGALDFSYQSAYGGIRSAWKVGSDGRAEWDLTIPPNSKGLLPLWLASESEYRLEGKELATSGRIGRHAGDDGMQAYELPAGSYHFTIGRH